MRRGIILLAAALVAGSLLPSAAATTHQVDVRDSFFDPSVVVAEAGDTVTWTWQGSLGHNVTAHQGATFASPTQSTGSFSATFGGGTVLYRCTIHSSLDAQGRCNGMCGLVTDDATPPPSPTVNEPAAGATVRSPVRISGSAQQATRVLIFDGDVQRADVPVATDGGWAVQVTMSDGTHTIDAIAVNARDVRSDPTSISITVDATPPTVAIAEPSDLSVVTGELLVAGTASDERSLASVTVTVADAITGAEAASTTLPGTSEWSASFDVGPGFFAITATARDVAGNTRTTDPVRVLVL